MKRYVRRTHTVWTALGPFLFIVSEGPPNCLWFTNIKVECPHPCHSWKKIMVQLQFFSSQLHFSIAANRLTRTDLCPGQLADPFRLLLYKKLRPELSLWHWDGKWHSVTHLQMGSLPLPEHSCILSSILLVRKRPQHMVLPKPRHRPNRDMDAVIHYQGPVPSLSIFCLMQQTSFFKDFLLPSSCQIHSRKLKWVQREETSKQK